MTCENGQCTGVGCGNFYMENGEAHCMRSLQQSAPASFFKARTGSSVGEIGNPINQLQRQFDEIFKVVNHYQRVQTSARKAALEALKARVNFMLAKTKRLALEQQLEGVKEARRTALAMIHPWGWARDLGVNISDYSLEEDAKLQQTVYHADVRPTYLDNPKRLAMLREIVYG